MIDLTSSANARRLALGLSASSWPLLERLKSRNYVDHLALTQGAASVNGIANGETIKANITASILLGRSLSLNGTIFYLDNLRYNDFFKIQGEIRAHF